MIFTIQREIYSKACVSYVQNICLSHFISIELSLTYYVDHKSFVRIIFAHFQTMWIRMLINDFCLERRNTENVKQNAQTINTVFFCIKPKIRITNIYTNRDSHKYKHTTSCTLQMTLCINSKWSKHFIGFEGKKRMPQ